MKRLKPRWPDWLRVSGRAVFGLSLAIGEHQARWVYGEVAQGQRLHFKTIQGHGGLEVAGHTQAQFVASDVLAGLLQQILTVLPGHLPKPQILVLCLPARQAYFGELTVPPDEEEQTIEFQIQDMMEAAAGNTQREAAYDWQLKATSTDGDLTFAVAGIDQVQVDQVIKACQQFKMRCAGITLDSVASINGYLQMLQNNPALDSLRFLLHGELGKHRIRLAVFSQGVLLHESTELSDDGFSLVQSVAALERLVATWAREGAVEESGSVRLILGGEMMYAKGAEATVQRSEILSARLLEVRPRKELAAQWHDSVVPFGALEAMPCA
ncbi:MAG TPA: hypothetical protein VFV57_06225 [Limnobacter sp.]|nr:hypothetical protein [Limnobacter sp.]